MLVQITPDRKWIADKCEFCGDVFVFTTNKTTVKEFLWESMVTDHKMKCHTEKFIGEIKTMVDKINGNFFGGNHDSRQDKRIPN